MTVSCRHCQTTWPRDPALEVACPTCMADFGKACRRPSGHGCDTHASRDQAAMDAGVLKPCRAVLVAEAVEPLPLFAGLS